MVVLSWCSGWSCRGGGGCGLVVVWIGGTALVVEVVSP